MRSVPHAQAAVTQKVYAQTQEANAADGIRDSNGHTEETRDAATEFLTGPDVQARYRKSHVTIWRWIRDSDLEFPPPIKINRLNYWRLSELENWEASQAVLSGKKAVSA